MRRLLLATLFIVGCGEAPHVDPELQSYLDQFQADGAKFGVEANTSGISAVFVESLGGEVVGLCKDGTISIAKSGWDRSSKNYKQTLMYHELGHCVLGRHHVEEMRDGFDGPESVMFPDVNEASISFQSHKDYYLEELFTSP